MVIEVLVVDDDASLRESLGMALADRFGMRTAESGEQALRLMLERVPDVLVLDEQMPGLSGTELMDRLGPMGPPAVILLSASADVGLARRAMHLGAFDVLAKPFDLGDLAERISQAALGTRQRHPEAPFGLLGLKVLEASLNDKNREAISLEGQTRLLQLDLANEALARSSGDKIAAARSLQLSKHEFERLRDAPKP